MTQTRPLLGNDNHLLTEHLLYRRVERKVGTEMTNRREEVILYPNKGTSLPVIDRPPFGDVPRDHSAILGMSFVHPNSHTPYARLSPTPTLFHRRAFREGTTGTDRTQSDPGTTTRPLDLGVVRTRCQGQYSGGGHWTRDRGPRYRQGPARIGF